MAAVETVVICAAGTGSRLGVGVPKCLVSIDGRTIIDRQLDLLDDVPDVRVTVGYREELVVRHVVARRPDVVFCRNPDFQSTATLTSLCRAVADLDRPFLALDGDLLVRPESFRDFMTACEAGAPVIGISRATTDDAVFVTVDDDRSPTEVRAFHRAPAGAYEWSGPAFLEPRHLGTDTGYVYEAIEPHIPARAFVLDTAEVDTPDDLDRARLVIRSW